MIDTVLLCVAWAVFGYALALIEHERSSPTPNPRQPHSADHTPPQPSCQRHIAQAPPRPFRVFPLQAMATQPAVYDLLVRLGSARISRPMRRIRPEARPLTY